MAPPDRPTGTKITCCVLAWNEVASLRTVVASLRAQLGSLDVPFDVLIIDDGSTDGTGEAADALALDHPDTWVIHHTENRGLGGVYRTGLESARGEFITFFPADGQFPADNLRALYPHAERFDLVLGTLPRRTDSLLGAVLSRSARLIHRGLFGLTPRLEGVFMLRRSVLDQVVLETQGRGWTIIWELIFRAQRQGYRLTEHPVTLQPRSHGASKVNNVRSILSNMKQLIDLRRRLD